MASRVFGQLERAVEGFTSVEVYVNKAGADKMNEYKKHPLFPSVDRTPAMTWFYARAAYLPPPALPFGTGGGGALPPTEGQLWPRGNLS